MFFTRRSIQNSLNELRIFLGNSAVDEFAARLNIPGKDKLAAMWEVVMLLALARHGLVEHEKVLDSGKRPDVHFSGRDGFSFVADITCVSDDGLDKDNPIEFLYQNLQHMARRLNLPPGGIDLRVEGKKEEISRGIRTRLKLPRHGEIPVFVRDVVEVEFKAQLGRGEKVLSMRLENDDVSIDLSISIGATSINTLGHPTYDVPSIVDRNPLYSALSSKAKNQLKGVKGSSGVIVCDGDCKALTSIFATGRNSVESICSEFFRQFSSIDFVWVVSVDERNEGLTTYSGKKVKFITSNCFARPRFPHGEFLQRLLKVVSLEFPAPINTPVNAAYRSVEKGYGPGHRGGYTRSGNNMKISSRVVMELLSGRKTIEEFNNDYEWVSEAPKNKGFSQVNPFELYLKKGMLPIKVSIEEGIDDDWLEFEFGEPDAAVYKFI